MCPNEVSLQVWAWTAGSAWGWALLYTHAHRHTCLFKSDTHTQTYTYSCRNSVSSLSRDEVMQNDISGSCFCMWLIALADNGSSLSLLGVSKQARLSLHTSPELDVALLIPTVMWRGWWSLRRKWMFCKRRGGWMHDCVIWSQVLEWRLCVESAFKTYTAVRFKSHMDFSWLFSG